MPRSAASIAWNTALEADFRANAGQITSGPMQGRALLLMTTVGVKSGQPRVSALAYTRDGDKYVVVGSNSGAPVNPAWIANIEANPMVTVEVGPETFRARAFMTAAEERQRLWDAHVAVLPAFLEYLKMTDRELPVVTLERIASA